MAADIADILRNPVKDKLARGEVVASMVSGAVSSSATSAMGGLLKTSMP